MSMETGEASSSSTWSREQEKEFENALAIYVEDSNDRWEKIAADVPGKTVEEIRHHFQLLLEDINSIESDHVPLPCYVSSSEGSADCAGDGGSSKKAWHSGRHHRDSHHGGKGSKSDQERRKGIAWTEDEHRLFLLGLEKYGKGDWRSISRNFVISRTPTQVASHAQKYFIRLNSMNKDRRRSSIHDITSVGNSDLSAPQGPITGETNGSVVPSGQSSKQTPHQLPAPAGAGVYGTPTIGQPIGGSVVPAVGRPVNFSPTPHMAYGVRVPVAGPVVPGAPVNAASLPYSMPHMSAHR